MATTTAKTEEIDKMVRKYSEDLKDFKKEMLDINNSLKLSVTNASSGWEGSGYEAFKDLIFNDVDSINSQMNGIDPICEKLDKLSERFQKILSIMNKYKK